MQGIGQELYTNYNYVKILTKTRRAHGIKHTVRYLLTLVLEELINYYFLKGTSSTVQILKIGS